MAGDLNNPPDSLHMRFMQSLLPRYQDAWVAAKGTTLGPTANDPQNIYSESFLRCFLLRYTLKLCAGTEYQHHSCLPSICLCPWSQLMWAVVSILTHPTFVECVLLCHDCIDCIVIIDINQWLIHFFLINAAACCQAKHAAAAFFTRAI